MYHFSTEFMESPYYYEIDKPDPETGFPFTMALKPGAPLKFQKQLEIYKQWCMQDTKDIEAGIDR